MDLKRNYLRFNSEANTQSGRSSVEQLIFVTAAKRSDVELLHEG